MPLSDIYCDRNTLIFDFELTAIDFDMKDTVVHFGVYHSGHLMINLPKVGMAVLIIGGLVSMATNGMDNFQTGQKFYSQF